MAKPKTKLSHAGLLATLAQQVLEGPARLGAAVRRAASRFPVGTEAAIAAPAVAGYLDKVARWAYKVTDDDVTALRAAGLSEDEIFELTVAAAIGAGVRRQEAALAAVRAAAHKGVA